MGTKLIIQVNDIFTIFALYGYRKTSMEDVALKIGCSRQALYKKFRSKEALFNWMVTEMSVKCLTEVRSALLDNKATLVSDRLIKGFDALSGQFIDVLRSSPHGSEIFDKAIAVSVTNKSKTSITTEVESMIATILFDEGIAKNKTHAENIAFMLYISSKGLMLTAENRQVFINGMQRIISIFIT